MMSVYNHILRKGKPDDISDETWNEYVNTKEKRMFWRLNSTKTLMVTISVTFGLNLILNETLDMFLHNPHNHSIDATVTTITIGIICILVAFVTVFVIDKAEEYKRLKQREIEVKKEKEEKMKENKLFVDLEKKIDENYISKEELQKIIDERLGTKGCK